MKIYLHLLICLTSTLLIAQRPTVKKWDKDFGGTENELLYSFRQTTDGGYLLSGTTNSNVGGDISQPSAPGNSNIQDIWVVKTDSLGSKQWERRLGGNSCHSFLGLSIEAADGGYLVGAYIECDSGWDVSQPRIGTEDYWIVKLDAAGNKLWDRRFGGLQNNFFSSMIATNDGGYLLGGWTDSQIGGDVSEPPRNGEDYWIVKIDSSGIKQWDKRFGGRSTDYLTSLAQTKDGGYYLAGYTYSDSGGDMSQFRSNVSSDFWLVRTDASGTKLWDRRFGGDQDDLLSAVATTKDGGCILSGTTNSHPGYDVSDTSRGSVDYWVVKVGPNGAKQWDKRYGGLGDDDNGDNNHIGQVSQNRKGEYLISGASGSPITGDVTQDCSDTHFESIWSVKTDSTGTPLWDKAVYSGDEDWSFALQTDDHCYVFATDVWIDSAGDKTQASKGGYDFWMVKYCDTVTRYTSIPEVAAEQPLRVYPSPASGVFTIDMSGWDAGTWQVYIYDQLGQVVYQAHTDLGKMQIDTPLAPGLYILGATQGDQRSYARFLRE